MNLLHAYLYVLLLIVVASCTQTSTDSATTVESAEMVQLKAEKKVIAVKADKPRHDASANSEGIFLSQADVDGDNFPESIAVCETASICVNHPASGINHTYTDPRWERLVLLAIQDTDGEKGAEIVTLALTSEGALACICIIHDRSQSVVFYLGSRWYTATVKYTVDTNGEPGDEVVLVAYDHEGHLECVCIIRDKDRTYQVYVDTAWASVSINWVEDTDANPGAEVVLEINGQSGTAHCVCIIHHKEDRVARYSDPRWQRAIVQMFVDTDGTRGNEVVVLYSSEIEGGLSIIHDSKQALNTFAFPGDYPAIQQVDNYDNIPGAELCVLLVNQQTYEVLNDHSGGQSKVESCHSEQPNAHT